MILKGRVHKFGDDIDTDRIIPARYLNLQDPKKLAQHCFEGENKNFIKNLKRGDIIFAGENFGCGSSREHAPLAIKYAGVSCVIAKSFARIFYRNSINIGLPILESRKAVEGTKDGDLVKIDLRKGEIENLTSKKKFLARPFPPLIMKIINAGGLIKLLRKKQ